MGLLKADRCLCVDGGLGVGGPGSRATGRSSGCDGHHLLAAAEQVVDKGPDVCVGNPDHGVLEDGAEVESNPSQNEALRCLASTS